MTLKKFYGQAKSKRTKEFWNKLVISNLVSTRFHLNSLSQDFDTILSKCIDYDVIICCEIKNHKEDCLDET